MDAGEWECGLCTEVNTASDRACTTCGTLRRVKPAGAAAAAPKPAAAAAAKPRLAARAPSAAGRGRLSDSDDVICLDDDEDDDSGGGGGVVAPSGGRKGAAAAPPARKLVPASSLFKQAPAGGGGGKKGLFASAASGRGGGGGSGSAAVDASRIEDFPDSLDGDEHDEDEDDDGGFGGGRRRAGSDDSDEDDDDDDSDDDDDDEGFGGYKPSRQSSTASSLAAAAGGGAKRRKLTAEEREAEKRRKEADKAASKAARERERSSKAAAKAATKEAARVERNAARSDKGGDARLEIAVVLSPDLAAHPSGAAIKAALLEEGYAVLPAAGPGEAEVAHASADDGYRVRVPDIPMTIHWRRRKVDPVRTTAYRPGLSVEPMAARLWPDAAFLAAIVSGGTDAIAAGLAAERARLPAGSRMVYVLEGLKDAARKWRRPAGAAGGSGLPAVTGDALDTALVHLYVSQELEYKETVSPAATAEYVVGLTRAIAEWPYKRDASALACVVKVRTTGTATAAAVAAAAPPPDGMKKPVTAVWLGQLQMIPGVSDKRAAAIAGRYPSFRALMDAYRDPRLPQAAKELLLEDLEGNGRKHTKLSRDIYRFFTTRDPNEVIGATTGK